MSWRRSLPWPRIAGGCMMEDVPNKTMDLSGSASLRRQVMVDVIRIEVS